MSELNGLFSLRTAQDLLDKLEADYRRLSQSDTASIEAQYAAFDFFVCAEHIPDWLKKTSGGSLANHRSYVEGAVVSHIANGAKHFRVEDPRHTTVRNTLTAPGVFDGNFFDPSVFACTPRLVVELESGDTADVLDLAAKVLSHWRNVLA
ncbi:MAG TPA: hypothetical protein PLN31_20845 [Azoarcus taiwanensis]|nr:hypothetical protein [Azoarcus taiwanensis]